MEGEVVGEYAEVWENSAARAYIENRGGLRMLRLLLVTVGSKGGGAGGAGSENVTMGGSGRGGGMSTSEMEKYISSGVVDVLSVSHGSRKAGGRSTDGAIEGGVGCGRGIPLLMRS